MKTYPSVEERAKITARRKQLRQELIPLLVSGDVRQTQKPMQRLIRQYGQTEVERMLNSLQRTFSRDTANETLWMYREYYGLLPALWRTARLVKSGGLHRRPGRIQ